MLNDPTDDAKFPPDWWVTWDDETAYYTISPEDAPYIASIRGVYAYDSAQHTYCCEITPSYWMVEVRNYILFTDALYALPDEEQERLRDQIEEKYIYCVRDDSSHYAHVRDVEARREKHPDRFDHYGAVRDPEDKDRGEREVIEHQAGNPAFC